MSYKLESMLATDTAATFSKQESLLATGATAPEAGSVAARLKPAATEP